MDVNNVAQDSYGLLKGVSEVGFLGRAGKRFPEILGGEQSCTAGMLLFCKAE